MSNGTCDYRPESVALAWIEWVPRLHCGWDEGPCHFEGASFSPFDIFSRYWVSLAATMAILPAVMLAVAMIFLCCGVIFFCCKSPKSGPRRSLPVLFYLLSLGGVPTPTPSWHSHSSTRSILCVGESFSTHGPATPPRNDARSTDLQR